MPRIVSLRLLLLLAFAFPIEAALDGASPLRRGSILDSSRSEILRAAEEGPVAAYSEFRRHLPFAKRVDGVGALFTHFLDLFSSNGRFRWRTTPGLVRLWARDAVRETDEEYRVWYSLGMNEIRQVHEGGVTLGHFLLRPGGEIEIYWLDPEGRSPPPPDMRVEIARLERGAEGEPLRYLPLHAGAFAKSGLFHAYRRKIASPGSFRVSVWNRDFFQQAYVQVTALDLALKDDGTRLLAWGASPGNRVPPPYRVRITAPDGRVRDTATDSSGLLPLSLPRDPEQRRGHRIRLEKDGHLAFGSAWPGDTGRPGRWALHAFTDRPRYRPGDRVHFRGLVKLQVDGRTLADGWRDSLAMEVSDGRGELILRRAVPVDPWGGFGDSLDLPPQASLGRWQVMVFPRWTPSGPASEPAPAMADFAVEEYRKPEFTLEAEACFLPKAGKVRLTVRAAYLGGGPVSGIPVAVDWRAENGIGYGVRPSHWGDLRYGYRAFAMRGRDILRRDTVRLDALGSGVLEIPSPLPEGRHALVAELTARDQTGRTVPGEAKVVLTRSEAALEAVTDKFRYEAGDLGWLRAAAYRRDGKALAGRFRVRIERDGKPWLDTAFRSPAGGTPPLRLVLEKTGQYHAMVELEAPEGGAKPLRAEVRFLVVKVIGSGPDIPVRVNLDRGRFRSGDSLGFTLTGRWGASPLLVTLEGAGLGAWQVLKAPGAGSASGRLALPSDAAKQAKVCVLYPGPLGWEGDSAAVDLPDSAFLLRATIEAATTWKPGERFRGRLRVRDARGKPARARFSLGVVDEGVYAGQPPPRDSVAGLLPSGAGNRVRTRLGEEAGEWFWGLGPRGEPPVRPGSVSAEPWRQYFYGWPDERRLPVKRRGARFVFGPVSRDGRYAMMHEDTAYVLMSGLAGRPGWEGARIAERSDFRDLAWWAPALETYADGTVPIAFDLPDDLTEWRLSAKGAGPGAALLDFTGGIRTRQDLSIRLSQPRLWVAGDSASLTARILNATGAPLEAEVRLESADPGRALPADSGLRRLTLPPGNLSVTFPVRILRPGRAAFKAVLHTPAGGDAESRSVPIEAPGLPFAETRGGVLDGDSAEWTWTPPPGLQAGSVRLRLEAHAHPIPALLSAAGSLLEYPYGCVEQTLSRFVPVVLLAQTLRGAGLRDTALERKAALFAKAGLDRLGSMQRRDGGWGWWSGSGLDPRMTALVVEALDRARRGGLPPALLRQAEGYLAEGSLALERNLDTAGLPPEDQVRVVHALARGGKPERWMRRLALTPGRRDSLPLAARAQWLELVHAAGLTGEKAALLEGLEKDLGPQARSGSVPVRVREGEIAGRAAALGALLTVAPDHALVPALAAWLHHNRQGEGWGSTRTTAEVISVLGRHAGSGDGKAPDGRLTVFLNGRLLRSAPIKAGAAGTLSWVADLDADELDSLVSSGGRNRLCFVHAGSGRLFWSARLHFAALEPPGKSEPGLLVKRFYRRSRYVQTPAGWARRTSPLGGKVKALRQGDEVEVQLHVEAAETGEYLLLEDHVPAGLEYLERGTEWRSTHAKSWYLGHDHAEARDGRVAFFQTHVPKGKTVFTYLLRAETPGTFQARPARVELMYRPEVSAQTGPAELAIGR